MYFKMERLTLFFLFFAVPTIFSEDITTSPRGSPSLDTRNQSCTTSKNVSGICVSIFQCKKLFDIYTRGSAASNQDKQLLRSAHCGSRPLDQRVCCEKAAVSKTTEQNTNKRCGESPFKKNNAKKVKGGIKSTMGAWPWLAALYDLNSLTNETQYMCAGSLIASDWVLTAAHCIPQSPVFIDHVRLGDIDINENVYDGANPIEVKVKNVIKHPKYSTNPMKELNDIALLHLEEPVTFFDFISPICLHKGKEYVTNENIYDQEKAIIAGWGDTENGTTTYLLEVSVDATALQTCKKIYAKPIQNGEVKLDNSVLCYFTPEKGACKGDSGGPVMFVDKGSVWSQGGIVSFGYGCDDTNKNVYPDVHTKVAPFIDWIEKETGLKF